MAWPATAAPATSMEEPYTQAKWKRCSESRPGLSQPGHVGDSRAYDHKVSDSEALPVVAVLGCRTKDWDRKLISFQVSSQL